ncbi:protein TIS11 isoform X1 [Tribolium castaneum]|nr:PREDICTED: protein TIS11 [Tribolium castaneum]|eukprot:XP_968440.1 PREDICTED: protein TIS11 [Tribolium castaneum]
MSTAIMSRYDFGDNLMKSAVSSRDAAPGSPLDLGSAGMRFALTRMASTPATNQNLTLLLGNLTQHRRLERAQSAPAPSAAAAAAASVAASAVNTSRYKTELCRPYEEFGVCKYGDKCQFAHGGAELRSLARHPKYKTELCRTYHTVGFCPYGPRCHFVHNQDEVVLQKQALARARPRPAALSPTLSLDSSSSPPCSLSQSPTSSMGSFFSSEPELHSPAAAAPTDDRLPVFNRLAEVNRMHAMKIGDLVL